jgi:hypothetical protein
LRPVEVVWDDESPVEASQRIAGLEPQRRAILA